jgi:uncharacterized protein (TIGR02145 family)
MFRFNKYSLSFLIICAILTIQSCKKKEEHIIIKEKVSGVAQKGPFIIGTAVTMSELNSSLDQTGKVFTTQIINDNGIFEINNVSLTSSFVEFSATGFYFDEVHGGLSQSPLYLTAISDITNKSTVNVNILTHLEKYRVIYLVKHNKTFAEAKNIAQSEILSIFGFVSGNTEDSESLDMTVNSENNAILIAISVILQWGGGVPELTELLTKIANDIKEDGKLDDESINTRLREAARELSKTSDYPIRTYLENRYQELGIVAEIPDFEKYLESFLSFSGFKPTIKIKPASNIVGSSVTLNGSVAPNSLSTTIRFEYGLTSNYGNSINATPTSVSGFDTIDVKSDVSGLSPATTYHFRIVAVNSMSTVYSNDSIFITAGGSPLILKQYTSDIKLNTIKLLGSVNPDYMPTLTTFEYGTSESYGQSIVCKQGPVNGGRDTIVTADISGLSENTTYHFRTKATNALGTVLGDDITFSTCDKIYDIEGNMYKTLLIGSQYWMVENLKTTKLNDGSSLINDLNGGVPGYSWYNNDVSNKNIYGALYNYYTLNTAKICPTGWHVPSMAESGILINFFGGEKYAGDKLKESGLWPIGTIATNESSFSALPGGIYDGSFSGLGYGASFWTSSSMSGYMYINFTSFSLAYISEIYWKHKYAGLSIRCVKD